MEMYCPKCNSTEVTIVDHEIGRATWTYAGIICVIGGWYGCCLIPFCLNDAKDTLHICSHCGHLIAIMKNRVCKGWLAIFEIYKI
jgi:lipopolysaccharide-induced tumor necrosis factor-alpha factor